LGKPIFDDTFLLLINAHHDRVLFTLPAHRKEVRWEAMLDTRGPLNPKDLKLFKGGQKYNVGPRSLALLRLRST
jgi:glycogen operon protein